MGDAWSKMTLEVSGGLPGKLVHRACFGSHVISDPQVHRLVDAAAFPEGVEVPAFHHLPDLRDSVVGWNSGASGHHQAPVEQEFQGDGSAVVNITDDERGGVPELELELGAAGGRTAGGPGGFQVLEDHPFFSGHLQFLKQVLLVLRLIRRLDAADVGRRMPGQQMDELVQTFAVRGFAEVQCMEFQQVKSPEAGADGFPIQQQVSREQHHGLGHGPWNAHGEPMAVDAGDLSALLAQQEAFAIHLLLHQVGGILDELADLAAGDGVEKLGQYPGEPSRMLRLVVEGAGFAGGVAFGLFLAHQLVVDGLGGPIADGHGSLASGAQGGASAAKSEIDAISTVTGFNGGLVDLV